MTHSVSPVSTGKMIAAPVEACQISRMAFRIEPTVTGKYMLFEIDSYCMQLFGLETYQKEVKPGIDCMVKLP